MTKDPESDHEVLRPNGRRFAAGVALAVMRADPVAPGHLLDTSQRP